MGGGRALVGSQSRLSPRQPPVPHFSRVLCPITHWARLAWLGGGGMVNKVPPTTTHLPPGQRPSFRPSAHPPVQERVWATCRGLLPRINTRVIEGCHIPPCWKVTSLFPFQTPWGLLFPGIPSCRPAGVGAVCYAAHLGKPCLPGLCAGLSCGRPADGTSEGLSFNCPNKQELVLN